MTLSISQLACKTDSMTQINIIPLSKKKKNFENQYYKSGIFESILWILTSSCSSIKMITSKKHEVEIDLSLIWSSFVIILTVLLLKGFRTGNPQYILPWILAALWTLFDNEYFSFEKFATAIYHLNKNWMVGYGCLMMALLSIGFKIYSWCRILNFAFGKISYKVIQELSYSIR